jgi:hypothetical protein
VNVWEPQKKYAQEMERIRFLEFDVHPGYVLYIPPYWWYSIKYTKGTANRVIPIVIILSCFIVSPYAYALNINHLLLSLTYTQ